MLGVGLRAAENGEGKAMVGMELGWEVVEVLGNQRAAGLGATGWVVVVMGGHLEVTAKGVGWAVVVIKVG